MAFRPVSFRIGNDGAPPCCFGLFHLGYGIRRTGGGVRTLKVRFCGASDTRSNGRSLNCCFGRYVNFSATLYGALICNMH